MNQPQTFSFDIEREMAEAEAEAFAGFCKIRRLDPAQPDTRAAWIAHCDFREDHPGLDPDQDEWPDEDERAYWPDDED